MKRFQFVPGLIAAQQPANLSEHDTAGDPMTGVLWTHRTTERIARELANLGISVCADSVATNQGGPAVKAYGSSGLLAPAMATTLGLILNA